MTKNTDPKNLDQTNVGDYAVLTHEDGSSQSCVISKVTPTAARVEWKTCISNTAFVWLRRDEWGQIILFPAGCKFLAV